jgi:hypothetical protein
VALAGAGPDPGDLDVVRDLPGQGVALWHVDPRGQVQGRVEVRATA